MSVAFKHLLQASCFPFLILISSCGTAPIQTNAQKLEQAESEQVSEPNYKEAAKINAELCIIYTQRNMLDLAKIKVLKAKKLYDLPIVYTAFGVYYAKLGKEKLAIESFEKSIIMAPEDARTLTYYAGFLCNTKRFTQAEKLYEKSLNLPGNIQLGQTYLSYAVCEKSQGNTDYAEKLFIKSLEQNSDIPFAWLSLAQIYTNQKKYDDANRMLIKYLEMTAQNQSSLMLEVEIAEGLKQDNRAATARLILESLY